MVEISVSNDNQPAKVHELGPHGSMTVSEAIDFLRRQDPNFVLMIYENKDGELCVVGSKMNRAEGLWIMEQAKMNILNGETEEW